MNILDLWVYFECGVQANGHSITRSADSPSVFVSPSL